MQSVNTRRRLTFGVAAACLLGLLFLSTTPPLVSVYDEGLVLTGASRVLAGELPSRDFYANYGPAQFLVAGGFFRIFGFSMLAARILDAAQLTAIPVLSWLILRVVVDARLASVGALVTVSLLLMARSPLYPVIPALGLVLVAAWLTIGALLRTGPGLETWAIPPAIGLAALFRYDLGIAAGLALGVGLIAGRCLQVKFAGFDRRAAVLSVTGLIGGSAAVALAIAGMLNASGILAPALHDLIRYNLENYAAMRGVPFPGAAAILTSPGEIFVYFVPAALCFVVLVVIDGVRRTRAGVPAGSQIERSLLALIVLAALSAVLFFKGWVRTSALQMLAGNVPAVLMMMIALDLLRSPRDETRSEGTGRVARFALPALVAATLLLTNLGHIGSNVSALLTSPADPKLPRLWPLDVHPDWTRAAHEVVRRTAPDERILSANGRHDRLVVNDVSLYALADRLPGTRWHHFDPGVQTSAAVQREMIVDLNRSRVKVVVRNLHWDGVVEPNQSARSSGVTLLDEHLKTCFEKVAEFGLIEVLTRRTAEGARAHETPPSCG